MIKTFSLEEDIKTIDTLVGHLKTHDDAESGIAVGRLLQAKCHIVSAVVGFGALGKYEDMIEKDMGSDLKFSEDDIKFS